jgi:serine/threonine-protein kinase
VKVDAGQILSGTLRLVRKIADGGMGSVWLGEHLVLGTDVAVKLMSGPWAAVPSARARFLREARMTALIDSPHVVRVLDCRHDEADEPYIVLELLRGENVEQRVRKHGPLALSEVVEIVAQTCEALAATHAAGVVHRDLKPENVFLVAGTTTFVKLLDYGVAKPLRRRDCLDVDLLPAGTPQYMSPEHMFEPETTEPRSDLFSLAAVAYFALTRRTPFEADSMQGLYFAIDGGTFPRPSALRAELPPAIDRWFEKALAHRPDDRFASAREMADALYDAVRASPAELVESDAGQNEPAPVSTTTPTMFELSLPRRIPRGMRKRAVATLALAMAAASMLVWRSGPEVQEASASTMVETTPDAGPDGPPVAPTPRTADALAPRTAGAPAP